MPIAATDIVHRYSTKSGTAGNSLAGTAAGSLGKYVSTTPIVDATLGNLFDDVAGDENAALNVEYRCFFVCNLHPTLTLKATKVWLVSEVAGGAGHAIALDNIVASALGATAAQAASILNEDTAPTGVGAFSTPTTKTAGLLIGDIPAGFCRAIWVRRTPTNSVAVSNDGVTLRIEGESDA